MAICEIKKVKKVKLCSGDMENIIDIVSRTIGAPTIGSSDPKTTFETLASPWAVVETIGLSGSNARRFAKINIEDRPTHIFSIFYDSVLWPLDSDNNFVEFDDRRFRIVGATDLNEMKTTIEILGTERGADSLAGTKA